MNLKEGVGRIWIFIRAALAIGWLLGLFAILVISYSGRDSLDPIVFALWICSYFVGGGLILFAFTGKRPFFFRFSGTLLAFYPFFFAIPESMSGSASSMLSKFLQVLFSWGVMSLVVITVVGVIRWISFGFTKRA
jgi:hypothetical protein